MNKNNKEAKIQFDEGNRQYFKSIASKPLLSVPVVRCGEVDLAYYADPAAAVILWIFEEYKLQEWIDLVLVVEQEVPKIEKLTDNLKNCCDINSLGPNNNEIVLLNLSNTYPVITVSNKSVSFSDSSKYLENIEHIAFRQLACEAICNERQRALVIVQEKQLLISGQSSVIRFLIKFSQMKLELSISANNSTSPDADGNLNKDELLHEKKLAGLQKLMGYNGGCLQACAETSVWTKFCEFDIFKGLVKAANRSDDSSFSDDNVERIISKELVRFEYHLRKPIKMHNIRKAANVNVLSLRRIELEHTFAEGLQMLLSDLILYPSVHLFLEIYGKSVFEESLPHIFRWYSRMEETFQLQNSKKLTLANTAWKYPKNSSKLPKWKIPTNVPEETLYKSDKERYNPALRCFTRQPDIEDAMNSFSSSGLLPSEIVKANSLLNWDEIPLLAQPEGGNLPIKRREKKCQQLTGMVVEVLKVVEKVNHIHGRNNGDTIPKEPLRIVDFCSGGGHVGILLAFLLPKCQIILVENKEDSLRRARERIEKLGLTNVLSYQSNVDYFYGEFDIGVSLHACGTATDLVLNKCIQRSASFVCCPCCYGSMQVTHMLHYPRSLQFKNQINLKHYFILAHASDQTGEKTAKTEQGKLCMQIIDTDRCLYAEENLYSVYLTKILPETASPKNHIIVGISPSKCLSDNPL